METEGKAILTLPEVRLIWDQDKQDVQIQFKMDEFKNLEFILIVLEMAKRSLERQVEMNFRMAAAKSMQQNAILQSQIDDVRRRTSH